uniref:Uncharacterized protein n=1 Tax=Cannabis sativa TaxID=3483 RepID=A0A803QDW7_CANSA
MVLLEPYCPLPLEVGTEESQLSSQHATNNWRNLLTLGCRDWDLAIRSNTEDLTKRSKELLHQIKEHEDVVAKKWSNVEVEVSRTKDEAKKQRQADQ